MLWYNPTLDQNCPTWVYASWAIGLFLYQTFDAVDGSQAYGLRFYSPKEDVNTGQTTNASERSSWRAVRPWYAFQ